jgi:hypothetical protein
MPAAESDTGERNPQPAMMLRNQNNRDLALSLSKGGLGLQA